MRFEKPHVLFLIISVGCPAAITSAGCQRHSQQKQAAPKKSIASQITVQDGETLTEFYQRLPELPTREGIARYGGSGGNYFEAFEFSDGSILQVSLDSTNRVNGKLSDDERNWPIGFDIIRESR